MTKPIEDQSAIDDKILATLRESILEDLNAHTHIREPRCLSWDLYWIQSCLNAMEKYLTLTQGSRHCQIQEVNLLIRRFFDDAFPHSSFYRQDPHLATRAIQYAFDYVAPLNRDEETLVFEFENTTHSISIWDTYTNVRNAFDAAQKALKDLIPAITYEKDEDIIPHSRQITTPTPRFSKPITSQIFLRLQVKREFITNKDLACDMGCSKNTITLVRKELKKRNLIEETHKRGGFRLKAEFMK